MTREVHLYDPQTLYRHWEETQWSPWEVDLATDCEQWNEIGDRSLVTFVLGSLMVAEERITTKFSGLVGAYGSEEEATFLATQQVDEARHMQFYARFQDEVISEPAVIAEHVERAREQVSPAFRTVFDDKLVAAHDDYVTKARQVLLRTTDEFILTTSWRLLAGGQVVMNQPRHIVLRDTLNHLAHHRGQLTVYLRLCGRTVPAIYGPSADDQHFA